MKYVRVSENRNDTEATIETGFDINVNSFTVYETKELECHPETNTLEQGYQPCEQNQTASLDKK